MEFGSRTHEGLMRSIERRLSSLERRRSGSGAGLVGGGGIPTGTIITGAWQEAPGGWMICDGSAISRTGLTEGLFLAIGTAYGDGDGSTTFNLPDLRGRVAVGASDSLALGATGGAASVTLTQAEMPGHTHGTEAHAHTQDAHGHGTVPHSHGQDAHRHSLTRTVGGSGQAVTNAAQPDGPGGANRFTLADGANEWVTDAVTPGIHNATVATEGATPTINSAAPDTTSTGGGAAHENMPPYAAVNHAIKL